MESLAFVKNHMISSARHRLMNYVLVLFIVQISTVFAGDGNVDAVNQVKDVRIQRDIGSSSSTNNDYKYGYSSFYPNNQYGSYQAKSGSAIASSGTVNASPLAKAAVPAVESPAYYNNYNYNYNSQYYKQPAAGSYYPYNYPQSSYYNSASYGNNYYPYNSQYNRYQSYPNSYSSYPYSSYPYSYSYPYSSGSDQYYNNYYNYDQYYPAYKSAYASSPSSSSYPSPYAYSSSPYYHSAGYPTPYPTASVAVSESSEKKE